MKDGGLEYPWPQAEQYPLYSQDFPRRDDSLPRHPNITLIDLAIRDCQEVCELSDENTRLPKVVNQLVDPVGTWRNNMGRFVGVERLSPGSLQLRRNCNDQVSLDDEGEVDYGMINAEALQTWKRVDDWVKAKSVGAACMLRCRPVLNLAIGMRSLPSIG